MKTLNTYIIEKFQVSNDYRRQYAYTPNTKNKLIKCIKEKIEKEGLGTEDNPLNLNDIDTSKITDMSDLFGISEGYLESLSRNGYFDISDWDVSNVENMSGMFSNSSFDGDISDWDVSNVKDMSWMFYDSYFTGKNGDISNWNIYNVKNMYAMFSNSNFTGKNANISEWDVSNVENMEYIFCGSKFSGNLSKWKVKPMAKITNAFYACPLEKNPPKWYYE